MTRATVSLTCLVLASAAIGAQPKPPARAVSAAPLLAQVFAASATPGFRVRATLTRTDMKTKARQVHQLVISGKRTATRSNLLIRVAWPPEASREAVMIEDRGDHQLSGFQYTAGRLVSLASPMRGERLLGSDLLFEDLEFGFWFWPAQTIAGGEAVGEYDCTIIESRPPAGWRTGYSSVKSWIAPALSVPLRIEEYDAGGRLAKRLGMYRILKLGTRWLPAILTVEPSDARTRTVLEGVKYDANVRLTDADFSRASAQRPLAPAEQQE
jgi:hypothetical protein